MAGALKDHERATLLGVTTFGTGTVLEQFVLADGSAMLLATAEWLTPDGTVIWQQGVKPQVSASLPEGVTPVFPRQVGDMTASELEQSGDIQVLRAIEVLSEPAG